MEWSGAVALLPHQLNTLTLLINEHLSTQDGLRMWGISGYSLPLVAELAHCIQDDKDTVSGRIRDSRGNAIATVEFNVNNGAINFVKTLRTTLHESAPSATVLHEERR